MSWLKNIFTLLCLGAQLQAATSGEEDFASRKLASVKEEKRVRFAGEPTTIEPVSRFTPFTAAQRARVHSTLQDANLSTYLPAETPDALIEGLQKTATDLADLERKAGANEEKVQRLTKQLQGLTASEAAELKEETLGIMQRVLEEHISEGSNAAKVSYGLVVSTMVDLVRITGSFDLKNDQVRVEAFARGCTNLFPERDRAEFRRKIRLGFDSKEALEAALLEEEHNAVAVIAHVFVNALNFQRAGGKLGDAVIGLITNWCGKSHRKEQQIRGRDKEIGKIQQACREIGLVFGKAIENSTPGADKELHEKLTSLGTFFVEHAPDKALLLEGHVDTEYEELLDTLTERMLKGSADSSEEKAGLATASETSVPTSLGQNQLNLDDLLGGPSDSSKETSVPTSLGQNQLNLDDLLGGPSDSCKETSPPASFNGDLMSFEEDCLSSDSAGPSEEKAVLATASETSLPTSFDEDKEVQEELLDHEAKSRNEAISDFTASAVEAAEAVEDSGDESGDESDSGLYEMPSVDVENLLNRYNQGDVATPNTSTVIEEDTPETVSYVTKTSERDEDEFAACFASELPGCLDSAEMVQTSEIRARLDDIFRLTQGNRPENVTSVLENCVATVRDVSQKDGLKYAPVTTVPMFNIKDSEELESFARSACAAFSVDERGGFVDEVMAALNGKRRDAFGNMLIGMMEKMPEDIGREDVGHAFLDCIGKNIFPSDIPNNTGKRGGVVLASIYQEAFRLKPSLSLSMSGPLTDEDAEDTEDVVSEAGGSESDELESDEECEEDTLPDSVSEKQTLVEPEGSGGEEVPGFVWDNDNWMTTVSLLNSNLGLLALKKTTGISDPSWVNSSSMDMSETQLPKESSLMMSKGSFTTLPEDSSLMMSEGPFTTLPEDSSLMMSKGPFTTEESFTLSSGPELKEVEMSNPLWANSASDMPKIQLLEEPLSTEPKRVDSSESDSMEKALEKPTNGVYSVTEEKLTDYEISEDQDATSFLTRYVQAHPDSMQKDLQELIPFVFSTQGSGAAKVFLEKARLAMTTAFEQAQNGSERGVTGAREAYEVFARLYLAVDSGVNITEEQAAKIHGNRMLVEFGKIRPLRHYLERQGCSRDFKTKMARIDKTIY